MNTKKIADFALVQLDNLGYQLRSLGVTDRVNRHEVIAWAMTRQTHLKAELGRLEFKLELQKARIDRYRHDLQSLADDVVKRLPEPLAAPAGRLRDKMFAA
jgi:hypothetical protein